MNPQSDETMPGRLFERFRKAWFPPAAVVGAFSAFVAAAFRVRPEPGGESRPASSAGASDSLVQMLTSSPQRRAYELEYIQSAVLAGRASAHPFLRSLGGIAIGAGDRIFALGDDEVRIFEPGGAIVRRWSASRPARCLAAGSDGRVYLGIEGRVEIYDAGGSRVGGFDAGEKGKPAAISSIKTFRAEILVADAAARLIRRYEAGGRQLGVIGTRSKTGSFILPNKSLDIDVDSAGMVLATDTGRHRVTAWALDGSPAWAFGKFGMSDPADFVGCCNPVNVAVSPDGKIVTAEKMIARVKVYEAGGRLLAFIGPEHFDPACTHIHLAVDSKGRILAADPVRREIKVFSQAGKAGVNTPLREEGKRT